MVVLFFISAIIVAIIIAGVISSSERTKTVHGKVTYINSDFNKSNTVKFSDLNSMNLQKEQIQKNRFDFWKSRYPRLTSYKEEIKEIERLIEKEFNSSYIKDITLPTLIANRHISDYDINNCAPNYVCFPETLDYFKSRGFILSEEDSYYKHGNRCRSKAIKISWDKS